MSATVCVAERREHGKICLKDRCFKAVRDHFAAVGIEAVLDLPAPLIKDLLPHLTICQLDELQPILNQKGISTLPGWVGVLLDMCGPKHVIDLRTEEEAKHKVMKMLFTGVFYGFTNVFIKRNITNLNTLSFLSAAAKCLRQFSLLSMHKPLKALTAGQRPFLNLLEKCINTVGISEGFDLSKRETQTSLYVLHRLLDHGVTKDLVIHTQCPTMLAWLLHGRGSQYVDPKLKSLMYSRMASCSSHTASTSTDSSSEVDQCIPCKRSKLDSVTVKEELENANFTVDPQVLCQMFTPWDVCSSEACLWGQIECLEISQCRPACLRVLNAALPTFFCLRSLNLQSFSTFEDSDVMGLARALRQLDGSSLSFLTDLTVSALPYPELMEILLDASPNITSLQVEIQTVICSPRFSPQQYWATQPDTSELPLKRLTVKIAGFQTELRSIISVLQRSPHLTTFHMAGIRLPAGSSQSQLLITLSESNPKLRSLTLEDMKLSDCLPQIINLLSDCKLEDLQLNDCRLLESCSNKEEGLQQLVAALKTVPSLHTLGLAQNRLAQNVLVLVGLFTGGSPSSVKRLNLSSNFIQPAELLEFAKRLAIHHPPHQLTLDLRKNPADRDPEIWNAAVKKLCHFCDLLFEQWISTNTMADHISNM